MFCYDGLPFPVRLAMFALAAGIAWYLVGNHRELLTRAKSSLSRLSRRPLMSLAVLVVVSLGVNAVLTMIQYPQPRVHDEFAYQLAADTYASGRLTNPTHPHWKHFETFHVLSHPSYMAKYPPGNGLFLALGQRLTGHSITGSWLALAFALAALHWMLQAWIPARWSLAGCLLLAINSPMLMAWGQTWWGGGVQMAGGALLFGAMKRIMEPDRWKRPVWQYSIVFSAAAVLLSLTRPLEGVVACVIAGLVLLIGLFANHKPFPRWKARLVSLAVPAILIGGSGAAFLLINNYAVTGSAKTLPYTEHSKTVFGDVDVGLAIVTSHAGIQPGPNGIVVCELEQGKAGIGTNRARVPGTRGKEAEPVVALFSTRWRPLFVANSVLSAGRPPSMDRILRCGDRCHDRDPLAIDQQLCLSALCRAHCMSVLCVAVSRRSQLEYSRPKVQPCPNGDTDRCDLFRALSGRPGGLGSISGSPHSPRSGGIPSGKRARPTPGVRQISEGAQPA